MMYDVIAAIICHDVAQLAQEPSGTMLVHSEEMALDAKLTIKIT